MNNDLESAFAGLFMASMTSFEAFLQELFEKTVLGRARFPAKHNVRARVKVSTLATLHEVVLVGTNREFVEWLPFDNTLKRAGAFLIDGRPFSCLTDIDKGALTTFGKVRNALAHMSVSAHKKFVTDVAAPAHLPPRMQTPAAYLTSRVSPPTGPTRLEAIIGELGKMGRKLTYAPP